MENQNITEGIVRVCTACGKPMNVGYWVDDLDDEYYCSEECLATEVSDEQFKQLYANDGAYFTDWKNQLEYKHNNRTKVMTIYDCDCIMYKGIRPIGQDFSFKYDGHEYQCKYDAGNNELVMTSGDCFTEIVTRSYLNHKDTHIIDKYIESDKDFMKLVEKRPEWKDTDIARYIVDTIYGTEDPYIWFLDKKYIDCSWLEITDRDILDMDGLYESFKNMLEEDK